MKLRQRLVVASVVGLLSSVLVNWTNAESAGNEVARQQPLALRIPQRHLEIREKLRQKRIKLDFEKVPTSKVLDALSKALGERVYFDPKSAEACDPDLLNRECTVKTDHEVTLNSAVRRLLSHFGLGGYGYAFDDGLCLISSNESKDRYLMISHDMSYHSDYTTAKRRRLIEKIRNEISAGDWGKENGPWIGPSQNVYAIDVYHNAEVHGEIFDLRNSAAQAKRSSADMEKDKLPEEFFYAFQKKDLAKQTQIVERLRELYAYKSVSKRLEYEKDNDLPDPMLTAASVKRLQDREQRVNPKSKRYFSLTQVRGASLRLLHEEQVQDFVKREGFGRSRMPQPSPSQLRLLPLPSVPLASAEISTSIGEIPVRLPKTLANRAASAVSMPTEDMLALFHTYSQDKFLDPRGFGYVKDRDHVAGFSAHAFSYKPQWRWVDNREWYVPEEHWAIHRMELVSLLKFKKPAVYVSANLPKMEELADTETRPLDLFESDALSQLQKGEDLVPHATTNRIRMLGSLRADKQCLECHDVKRGHLLGAFSYVLLRDPALGLQE